VLDRTPQTLRDIEDFLNTYDIVFQINQIRKGGMIITEAQNYGIQDSKNTENL